MVSEETKWVIISWVVCCTAITLFAVYAIVRYALYTRSSKHDTTAAEFITARGTQGAVRIMFSFFASVVGAWCLVSPSQFAVYSGILALAMYSFASGMPVLIISLFGTKIQAMHPDVLSISDFAGKRFGPVFRSMVVLICLFNMSIGVLAEYTTIGTLFREFVGTLDYPIVIAVGVLTMLYTAYGGTYISIMTDQLQAHLTVALILVLTIFTAVTFREPLPKPLPQELGVNKYGYSSIFSLNCSLLAATVFSEAIWQKVWASSGRRAVVLGGLGGAILIMCAIFLFGFGGFLAAWGGLIDFETTNPNLFLFQVFNTADSASEGQQAQVRSWVGVISLMLASTMNESGVDSLQSGITGIVSSHFFRDQHIVFTRLAVLVINIPLIVVSLQGYPVLSLFLVSNMLTTCCFLPVLAGVFDCTRRFVSESAAIFGCCFAILTTCFFGAGSWWNATETFLGEPITSRSQAISYGVYYAWFGNVNYEWQYFLAASLSSVVGVSLWAVVAWLLHRVLRVEGPGVSAALTRIPGFGFLIGNGLGFDLLAKVTCGRFHYTRPLEDSSEEHSPAQAGSPIKGSVHGKAAFDEAADDVDQPVYDAPSAPPMAKY